MNKVIICDNCQKTLSLSYLQKHDWENPVRGEKVWCAKCFPQIAKGIFRCHEDGCDTELKTRDGDEFYLDLNQNIFCRECWISD